MSTNLRKTLLELNFVVNIKNKRLRKQILTYLSKDKKYRLSVREIALNIIKGNIKLNGDTKSKLRKYKSQILRANKTLNKKYLVQSGGWLHWIIPVVASLLNIVL